MLDLYRYISGQSIEPAKVNILLGLSLGGTAPVPQSEIPDGLKKYWLLNVKDSLAQKIGDLNELYAVSIDDVLYMAYTVWVRRYYSLYSWELSDRYNEVEYRQWCTDAELNNETGINRLTQFSSIVSTRALTNEQTAM